MSAPPAIRADRITVTVKLRPRLYAWVHSLAEETGLSDRQVIAVLLEDLAQRGAHVSSHRHRAILIHPQPREARRHD